MGKIVTQGELNSLLSSDIDLGKGANYCPTYKEITNGWKEHKLTVIVHCNNTTNTYLSFLIPYGKILMDEVASIDDMGGNGYTDKVSYLDAAMNILFPGNDGFIIGLSCKENYLSSTGLKVTVKYGEEIIGPYSFKVEKSPTEWGGGTSTSRIYFTGIGLIKDSKLKGDIEINFYDIDSSDTVYIHNSDFSSIYEFADQNDSPDLLTSYCVNSKNSSEILYSSYPYKTSSSWLSINKDSDNLFKIVQNSYQLGRNGIVVSSPSIIFNNFFSELSIISQMAKKILIDNPNVIESAQLNIKFNLSNSSTVTKSVSLDGSNTYIDYPDNVKSIVLSLSSNLPNDRRLDFGLYRINNSNKNSEVIAYNDSASITSNTTRVYSVKFSENYSYKLSIDYYGYGNNKEINFTRGYDITTPNSEYQDFIDYAHFYGTNYDDFYPSSSLFIGGPSTSAQEIFSYNSVLSKNGDGNLVIASSFTASNTAKYVHVYDNKLEYSEVVPVTTSYKSYKVFPADYDVINISCYKDQSSISSAKFIYVDTSALYDAYYDTKFTLDGVVRVNVLKHENVYYVSGYNPKIKLESIGDNIKSPVTYKLYQDGSLIYTGSISLSQTVTINQFSSSSTTRKIVFE